MARVITLAEYDFPKTLVIDGEVANKCVECDGYGLDFSVKRDPCQAAEDCLVCEGVGYHGVPSGPTDSEPGSIEKQIVMRTRRVRGEVMHLDGDRSCLDEHAARDEG